MTTNEPVKPLYVTEKEAELVLDSFKVSNTITRDLALKAAGLVMEFASASAVKAAQKVTQGDSHST